MHISEDDKSNQQQKNLKSIMENKKIEKPLLNEVSTQQLIIFYI
jgi:hypothetical protein